MKKFFIFIGLAFSVLGANAQNRKHIGSFSQFSQTYNPSLTGHQGSILKTLYRDRWTGFEDAPRTLVFSGELNLADVRNNALFAKEAPEESVQDGPLHAVGVSLVHDKFGPSRESRLAVNYSSGVRLTESLRLQGGVALVYNNSRIKADRLVFDNNDPSYYSVINGDFNSMNRYAVDLGISLLSTNYYVGYSVQDLAHVSDINSDHLEQYYKDMYPMQHIVQAGVRHGLTDQLGVVANGMYRFNSNEKGIYEGQLKGVYNNFFWVGAGYRQDLAYTFSGGIRLSQLNIGYLREVATGESNSSFNTANEIVVSYNLAPVLSSVGKTLSIW